MVGAIAFIQESCLMAWDLKQEVFKLTSDWWIGGVDVFVEQQQHDYGLGRAEASDLKSPYQQG